MASVPIALPSSQTANGTPPSSIVGTASSVRLTALEWAVVAMAERDGVSSVREPNRFIAALGSLFGFKRQNQLANGRLEALRRLAILAWHHRWNVPKSELASFFDAGFTVDQYELIQNSIGEARAARGRRAVR